MKSAVFVFMSLFVLFAVQGCDENNSPGEHEAKLVAGYASGSLTVPNTLSASLPILNEGRAKAEDVQAYSISIAGATLTAPTSLPAALGAIPREGMTTLTATFTSPVFQADRSYTIEVKGTFREQGHEFKFALTQSLQIPSAAPGSAPSLSSSSSAQTVNGAHYPPHQPSNVATEVNEGGHGWTVPNGPNRSPEPVSGQSTVQPAPRGDPPLIDFETNTSLPKSCCWCPNEPSGAVSGDGIVFETVNSYGFYSTNGTQFTQIDPTTIFPIKSNDVIFDQVVQYVPSIDRFIWIMQYGNFYRIAAASPASVKDSTGTSWTYWDITTAQVSDGTSLDYDDASVGNNYLYISTNSQGTMPTGRIVIRIPLSDIKSGNGIGFNYTKYSDGQTAYASHLTQNTLDEVFWAGLNDNTTIRVFNWPESSTSYTWTDVPIGPWPNTSMSSLTPDKQDWLSFLSSSFPGHAVLGAARVVVKRGDTKGKNEVLFAWSAGSGLGLPQAHVEWVALDRNYNFKLVSQQQIWNASYAFAYPAFAVNSNNEIGLSLQYGGGGNYENHVAGFWGDYILYSTTSSNTGYSRFGDYVTICPYTPDTTRFAAFGYGVQTGSSCGAISFDTHYVVFGRPNQ